MSNPTDAQVVEHLVVQVKGWDLDSLAAGAWNPITNDTHCREVEDWMLAKGWIYRLDSPSPPGIMAWEARFYHRQDASILSTIFHADDRNRAICMAAFRATGGVEHEQPD